MSEKPSATLSISELLSLCMQLNARIDTLWQRVVYSHAAMVGVMVFFTRSEEMFTVPRLLVLFFYTLNAMVTYAGFQESYLGLRAAVNDLRQMEGVHGHVYTWIETRNFDSHARRRALILGSLWLIICYLIMYPWVFDVMGIR